MTDDRPTPGPTPDTLTDSDAASPESDGPTPELITVQEAATLAGVGVNAIRKRYRSGDLTRRDDHGRELLAGSEVTGRVYLDADEVRRVYGMAQATDQKEPASLHSVQTQKEPAPDVPEGSLLVPVSAWEKMLEQLGNLHTAGQEVADARERAARAEEREVFAQERRREAENRLRAAEEELTALKANPAAPDLEEGSAIVTPPSKPTPPPETPAPAETSAGFVRSLIRRVRSR